LEKELLERESQEIRCPFIAKAGKRKTLTCRRESQEPSSTIDCQGFFAKKNLNEAGGQRSVLREGKGKLQGTVLCSFH